METEDEQADRLAAYGLAADDWALPSLVRMRVNPYDVVRALFTHLVIFGNSSEGQVHRDDVVRIKHVSTVYQREFPRDYTAFNAAVATLIELVTPPEPEQSMF